MPWLLRLFRRLARADRYFERRFTSLGRLVMGVLVVSALFAIDTRRTHSYQLLSVLAALVLVSLVWTWRERRGALVRRHLPAMATVREPVEYVLDVADDASASNEVWVNDRLIDP